MDEDNKETTRRANGARQLPACRYPEYVNEDFQDAVLSRLDALGLVLALLTVSVCLTALTRSGA